MGQLYLCKHNISDEDCYKCTVHRYISKSDCEGCEDFQDIRLDIPADVLALREKIMKEHGLKDKEI